MFLTALRIDESEVVLNGYARHAPAVVAALERRSAADRTRLEGAVTRENIAGIEWERFTVRFSPRTME